MGLLGLALYFFGLVCFGAAVGSQYGDAVGMQIIGGGVLLMGIALCVAAYLQPRQ